jgi:cyclophilin family peptidyl-prolyl cis-trans isomerase
MKKAVSLGIAFLIILSLVTFSLSPSGQNKSTEPKSSPSHESAAEEAAKQERSKERVVFHTNVGDIVVALFPKAAPKHVKQILRLASAGIFEGIPIYRVETGFVAQISNFDHRINPLTRAQADIVIKIPAEFSSIKHRRGHLSMARYDDINSAETSFSFMLDTAKHLDGRYTVFGEVVDGLDVLNIIETVATDSDSKPLTELTVLKSTVVPDGNMSGIQLAPAVAPNDPNAPYQNFFKVFALLAFGFTILLPIGKTFWTAFQKVS